MRFFRVIRVSVCTVCPLCQSECQKSHRHTFTFTQSYHTKAPRVSRLPPRSLFTGRYCTGPCFPCVSRLPPVSFYRYRVRSKLFNFIATLRGRQPSCAGVCELQGHYGLRAAPRRVNFATRHHDGLEQES